jgi:hypothetical protein
MSKSLVKSLCLKPPMELQPILEDFHLVGDETANNYINLFAAIVSSARPADSIDWLYVKDVVDLTWDIRRERAVKAATIELLQKQIVLDLLKTTSDDSSGMEAHLYRIFDADNEVRQWAIDPTARKKIAERLAARGFAASEILARAFIKGASDIDGVDRRIANYEVRKMVILREIERRNERLSRSLKKASADVVDAEYSEAAE